MAVFTRCWTMMTCSLSVSGSAWIGLDHFVDRLGSGDPGSCKVLISLSLPVWPNCTIGVKTYQPPAYGSALAPTLLGLGQRPDDPGGGLSGSPVPQSPYLANPMIRGFNEAVGDTK